MAGTQFGILVNLNDSGNAAPEEKDVDEIERTRMVADPEIADCIMQSPTLPHNSAGSDDLITNEEFDFNIPLSPNANAGNTTFTIEETEVCTAAGEDDDEDEVFFGPVGFAEVVVKKAVDEQEAETKMWSALTDAEMKEVMAEANRMAELIQEAGEITGTDKNNCHKDSAASPSLQSKPSITLSKILDSVTKKSNQTTSEALAVCSLTVTKSPGIVNVSKESLKEVQTKLFSASASPSGKENDIPKTRSKATPTSSGQQKLQANSAPQTRPVRRTNSLPRRSGSGLKPPSSNKSNLQEPKVVGTKRKKLDMNHSSEDLHTSLNSSNCSEAASESSIPSLTKSRLAVPSQQTRGPGLKRPCIKSQLQMPRAGMSKRTKTDGNLSLDELHTSLNSSTSSEMSGDVAVSQTSTRRSLPLPSKGSKLPSGLRKPTASGPSGIAQPTTATSTSSSNAAKPAIKSTLTKLDKLKSSLGAGISRIGGAPSRLAKPGSTSMLARPTGPLKALKPTVGAGQQWVPSLKRPATATGPNKKTAISSLHKSPTKSGDRRKSIGSPAGHATPKRTGVNRSQSFSGQRTPSQKTSTGSTPGSAQRRSLLPMVNQRGRTLSSNSSLPSVGDVPHNSNVLADIQNIADASPSCFKLLDISIAEDSPSYSAHTISQGKHRQI